MPMPCDSENPTKLNVAVQTSAEKCEQSKTPVSTANDTSRLFLARSLYDPQQRPHRDPRRAFRSIRLWFVAPRSPRNVEMRPRDPVGKLFQERGRRDRSCLATADVLDVGNVGANLFRVFLVERQLPVLLANFP